MGGQAFTSDVCDKCWGSGDKHNTWADIRQLEQKQRDWEEDQVLEYMHSRLGLNYDTFKFALATLVRECGKQERKRTLPEDRPAKMDAFWWSHTWHAMGNMLNKLVAYERRPTGK
jgi:hypothetical protein